MFDYRNLGGHVIHLPQYFGRHHEFHAGNWLKREYDLEMIDVRADYGFISDEIKGVLDRNNLSLNPIGVVVEMRANVYSRISFHLKQFPGTCAWVVAYWLSGSEDILDTQLSVVEQLAIWTQYGAVLVSQTDEFSHECVITLERHGFRAHPLMSSGNPHSGRSKWLWFKPLAAPHPDDSYQGNVYSSGFYSETVATLDEEVMDERERLEQEEYDENEYIDEPDWDDDPDW